jgi:hypothetical protein
MNVSQQFLEKNWDSHSNTGFTQKKKKKKKTLPFGEPIYLAYNKR